LNEFVFVVGLEGTEHEHPNVFDVAYKMAVRKKDSALAPPTLYTVSSVMSSIVEVEPIKISGDIDQVQKGKPL